MINNLRTILKGYDQLFGRKLMNWGYYPFLVISFYFLLFYAFLEIPDVKEWFNYSFHNWKPEIGLFSDYIKLNYGTTHISIFAAFIAAMLGIAIPISLTVISNLDKKYNQGGISKEFLNEPINKSQYYVLLINIGFLVISMFMNSIYNFFAALYTIFFFLTVINFIAYILLIISYLTNAKSHIYNKCEAELNQYLNGSTN